MDLVLYSDDINLLSHWEESLDDKTSIYEDLEALFHCKRSLIIMNYSACQNSCEEIISKLLSGGNRVLMLHRVPTLLTAKKLLRAGAHGYGNAMMRAHFITSAVETIKDGMVWLYPEFTSQLIMQLPSQAKDIQDELEKLTPREQKVALLLRDGDTYKTIAQKLDITPRTIKAHASSIYEKLGVKDRIGLALLLK